MGVAHTSSRVAQTMALTCITSSITPLRVTTCKVESSLRASMVREALSRNLNTITISSGVMAPTGASHTSRVLMCTTNRLGRRQ